MRVAAATTRKRPGRSQWSSMVLFTVFLPVVLAFVPLQQQQQVCRRQRVHNNVLCYMAANDSSQPREYTIRKSRHGDLGAVSDIILDSFYSPYDLKAPWRHLLRIKELDRLQQNFPYNDELHYMLVAEALQENSKENIVVGFCDVDARPKPPQDHFPPRPYLSDLAVHKKWRRRGIAKALVQQCEDLVLNQIQKKELYIRVEQENQVAIQMYKGLDYHHLFHPFFGVKDTTMLLHKKWNDDVEQDSLQQEKNNNSTGNNTENTNNYVL